MARFFINRPIVAMVISILMVIVGLVAMVQLPTAQYPNIAPPEILLSATYPGADALTLEQSVATPIEQQMSGVDNMLYMYSTNQTAGGKMDLRVNFDITTDPSYDQVLTNLRYTQAASQLPQDVMNQGVTVMKSVTSPLGIFVLYSPKGTYDPLFLSNYAYVNINDPLTRVPGVSQVQIFGAGKYAIRLWVNPDTLGKLDITVNEIVSALQAQNTVNPAGQLGGDPARLARSSPTPCGLRDAWRASPISRTSWSGPSPTARWCGSRTWPAWSSARRTTRRGPPQRQARGYHRDLPAPGSNAIETMRAATKLMEEVKARFPARSGLRDGARHDAGGERGHPRDREDAGRGDRPRRHRRLRLPPGLPGYADPTLAVPVALVGTFMVFPLLGFSINTLSLFGLVLAIGLVVDDAIVVVEAVEHHIELGLSPATPPSRPWSRCRDRWWRSRSSCPRCSCRRRSFRASPAGCTSSSR